MTIFDMARAISDEGKAYVSEEIVARAVCYSSESDLARTIYKSSGDESWKLWCFHISRC